MLADSERRADAESFVDRMADVATDAQCTKNIKVDLLCNRNGGKDVVPLLSVGLIWQKLLGVNCWCKQKKGQYQ